LDPAKTEKKKEKSQKPEAPFRCSHMRKENQSGVVQDGSAIEMLWLMLTEMAMDRGCPRRLLSCFPDRN
jgi:hypothetical protein